MPHWRLIPDDDCASAQDLCVLCATFDAEVGGGVQADDGRFEARVKGTRLCEQGGCDATDGHCQGGGIWHLQPHGREEAVLNVSLACASACVQEEAALRAGGVTHSSHHSVMEGALIRPVHARVTAALTVQAFVHLALQSFGVVLELVPQIPR